MNAGINGFGRFGLHLLKYWLDRGDESNFKIKYINDDALNINRAIEIIMNDYYVNFNKYKINRSGDNIIILEPNGIKHEIVYSNKEHSDITWLGEPDLFFECSGKNTVAKRCRKFLKGKTKMVLISATSWDAEKTLVFGYNHKEYNPELKIISYGSCTVNAYMPFANWIQNNYQIIDSDVNVIHNIQEYRLEDNNTLNRKFCTLEKSANLLMDSINENNFIVNYTVIPYSGISMIDFRFKTNISINSNDLSNALAKEVSHGSLKGLYGLEDKDIGPEIYNCTKFSTVFIREGIRVINDNLYFQGYFDNENSVNRFYDLVSYIVRKNTL